MLLTSNARSYNSLDPRLNRSYHHLPLFGGFCFENYSWTYTRIQKTCIILPEAIILFPTLSERYLRQTSNISDYSFVGTPSGRHSRLVAPIYKSIPLIDHPLPSTIQTIHFSLLVENCSIYNSRILHTKFQSLDLILNYSLYRFTS